MQLVQSHPLGWNYTNISTSAQTVIDSSPGLLHGILFNANNISAIALYDNTVSGGTTIATLPTSGLNSMPFYGPLDIQYQNGLVVSSGSTNTNITVVWGNSISN